jgi:hypothetical protein
VTVLEAQTPTHRGGVEVYVHDSAAGDDHYVFAHYNAVGETTISTSIYANDGAEYNSSGSKHSWKITTTALASYTFPYISPPISVYNEGTSAVTPRLECVRSGSATAYDNDELWTHWGFKGASGSTKATINTSDEMSLGGTPAAQATSSLGASDWTGESGTSWFGKLEPSASITPAEIGDVFVRVFFGAPSSTVYIDPQIRGLS